MMLPYILSDQVRQGLEGFLRTTFPPSNDAFSNILDSLFQDHEQGFFKGPYINLGLPFRGGEEDNENNLTILPDYLPYKHQQMAWNRLGGEQPVSTLVATGTGSGKTECFLYPILDHCFRHSGEPGIKVIIIYPMNALATDQAKRLAKVIYQDTRLKDYVTAGLFIGDDGSSKKWKTMQKDMVITDRDSLLKNPPDILLTNYKMLDLLLLRKKYFSLFEKNSPSSLKYLVVDEIHTFDGAQGSDLACLFRRLKHRLHTPEEHLCCVGTSATVGSNYKELLDYGHRIFGEAFPSRDVIIEEDYVSAEAFLFTAQISSDVPDISIFQELNYQDYSTPLAYIQKAVSLWFPQFDSSLEDSQGLLDLGETLRGNSLFQWLVTKYRRNTFSVDQLNSDFCEWFGIPLSDIDKLEPLWESLFSLISIARRKDDSGRSVPFLRLRVQLWARELRRLVAPVNSKPGILFSDDLSVEQREKQKVLPIVHCRDCGAIGWLSFQSQTQMNHRFQDDLQSIYQHFFNRSPNTYFIYVNEAGDEESLKDNRASICTSCLSYLPYGETHCSSCNEQDPKKILRIDAFRPTKTHKQTGKQYGSHDCPYCSGHESLTIVGSRSASINSVALSQVFGSPFNEDKKVIAFSDSVQDASHRAGFFSSRTYQFNLRMALLQLLQNKGEMPFPLLLREFKNHYLELLNPEGYFASFQAPRLKWIAEISKILHSKSQLSEAELQKGISVVDRGLYWDILTEIGHRSQVGRTLEKSGAMAIFVDREQLERAANRLYHRLIEHQGFDSSVTSDEVRFFLQGFLLKIRQKGAIINPITLPYLENEGNTFMLGGGEGNTDHMVVSHSRNISQPVFIGEKSYERFDSIPKNSINEQNWFALWGRKLFVSATSVDDCIADIYYEAIGALVKEDILQEKLTRKGDLLWGIPEDQLILTPDTLQLHCSHKECSRSITIPKKDLGYWEGMPCDRRYCTGRLMDDTQISGTDFYYNLYSKGSIKRIVSEEHTGLLNREEREQVEREFIQSEKPWSPNVLSATPTLEMGIDIGDLSSAFLCSVPPNVANYLQRIGRAGRTDGNSFLFTTAMGRPHDNYFFTNPIEMIQGDVDTPGLYIDAPRVLERQFFAFSLDTWLLSEENELPHSVKEGLSVITENRLNQFPLGFFAYLESNGKELLDEFCHYFSGIISERVKDYLFDFISTGDRTLQGLLIDALNEELNERNSLQERLTSLERSRDALMAMATRSDAEERTLREVNKEHAAVNSFIAQINRKNYIQFLTDQGLLPNYMFPETGITLRSIILKERSLEDKLSGNKREVLDFEYVRPASAALSELAPENTFYAGGHKAKIDQVDLSRSKPEEWRLCPACQHSEPKAKGSQVCCPSCGSPAWGDTSTNKCMIPLRQVTATTQERRGTIQDDSDDREQVFYARQMLIDIQKNQQITAFMFSTTETAFGFELVPKVEIREINFGLEDRSKKPMRVGGLDIYSTGFNLCSECGKVQDPRNEAEYNHAFYCSQRDKQEPEILNGIYLYRDFTSEALRILLPFKVTSNEKNLQSFIAAMFLGLQEYWEGKIDHIRSTFMHEPSQDSSADKNFLVFYDTVPGGTGYLRELLASEEILIDVMKKSLSRMKKCECEDGCYRCVFAYRHQRNLKDISKQYAIEILEDILSLSDSIENIDSLSKIRMEDYFESELEARFIEAIRRVKDSKGKEISLCKQFVSQYNQPGYKLKIQDKNYFIVPQITVNYGKEQESLTRPDFLFIPEDTTQKKIAVFTDGFQFHGSVAHNRIADDIKKRMALLQQGDYSVWTFSWNDVDSFINQKSVEAGEGIILNKGKWSKCQELYGNNSIVKDNEELEKPLRSFGLFLRYLESPEIKLWESFAVYYGLSLPVQHIILKDDNFAQLQTEQDILHPSWINVSSSSDNPYIYFDLNQQRFRFLFFIDKKGSHTADFASVRGLCYIDDIITLADEESFKPQWNQFWLLCNVMQFVNQPLFVSRNLIEQGYENPWIMDSQRSGQESPLEEILEELFDHDVISYVENRYDDDQLLPVIGYEILGSNGAVQAIAEVAWLEQKECIILDADSKPIFESAGWTIIDYMGGING